MAWISGSRGGAQAGAGGGVQPHRGDQDEHSRRRQHDRRGHGSRGGKGNRFEHRQGGESDQGFGIDTALIRSSNLAARGRRSDLLVAICREIGAHQYVSPQGSRHYFEEDGSFAVAGIDVVYHQYVHPEYSQLWGDFISHVSALDLLLNEEPRSLRIMRSGRGPHHT